MTDRKTNNSTPDDDNDIGADYRTATATAAAPPRSILSSFFSGWKHEPPKCPYKLERYYYYNTRNRNKNNSTDIISSKDNALGSGLGSEKDKEGGQGKHNHKTMEDKDKDDDDDDDDDEEEDTTNFEQSMDVYYPLVRLKENEDEHNRKHNHAQDQERVVVVLVMGSGWLGHVPMIYKVTHWWNTSIAHMICGTLGYPCIILRHSGGYFTNYFDYNTDDNTTTTTGNNSKYPIQWIQLNLIAVMGLIASLYVQNDTVMLTMSIIVVPVVVFLILNYQDHYPAAQLEDMVRDISTALHYIDQNILHHWKWNSIFFPGDNTEDKDRVMQQKKKDKKKIPIVFGGYSSGAHVAATLLTSSSLSPLIVHEENDDHGEDSEDKDGSALRNIGIVAVLYISGILDVPQSSFLMKIITYLVLGQTPRDIPSPLRTVHNLIKATAPRTKSGGSGGKEVVIQQNDSLSAAATTVTGKKKPKKNKKTLIQSTAKSEQHEQEQLLLSLLGFGDATKKKAEEAKEKLITTEQELGEEQDHNILSLFPASFASSSTTTTTTTTVRLRVPPHIIIGCQQEMFGLPLLNASFCYQKYADAVSQLMSTNNNNNDDDDNNGKMSNPINSADDDPKENVRLILLKDELIVNHWSILSSFELQKSLRIELQNISSNQHQYLN